MLGDLAKAITLKENSDWEIEAWTFLSNYPIPEHIGVQAISLGRDAGIDVSWRGPSYFAEVLQKFQSVRELFPNLLSNDLLRKLDVIANHIGALKPQDPLINWPPRNTYEQHLLISQKPQAWEYLLFAGVLLQGKERLEPKWRDFLSGHGRRTGSYLSDSSAKDYLRAALSDIQRIPGGIHGVLESDWQEAAFGPPGTPGDARAIEHIGARIIEAYEDLLDWAAEMRGAICPDSMTKAFDLGARVAERPAQDFRRFIDHAILEFSSIPDKLANGERVAISLTLKVDADNAALAKFVEECKRCW